MKTLQIPLILCACIILFSACSSSSYSLKEPHIYLNEFDEVVDAIDTILQKERMAVINAEYRNDDIYQIYFYKKSPHIQERNYQYGSTATMTIERIHPQKTSIKIKEEKQDELVKNEYQVQIAKVIFKALEEELALEPKVPA